MDTTISNVDDRESTEQEKEKAAASGGRQAAAPKTQTHSTASVLPAPDASQAAQDAAAMEAFTALVQALHRTNADPDPNAEYGVWREYAESLIDAHRAEGAEGVRKVWHVFCKDRPELETIFKERHTTTLADLAGILPSTNWLWKGWLPRGYLSLIVGATGVGKSWLTLRLAQSILTDTPWPDSAASQHGKRSGYVVWADTEASQALLLERTQAWDLPIGKILLPTVGEDPLSDIILDDNEGWYELTRLVHQYQPDLVVVDSLSGGHKGDENSSDMRNLLHDLAALARDHNVAVLATHHLRKANPMEALDTITLDRIRGSSAIPQFARLIMAVDRPDANMPECVRLKVIKSNLARFPEALGFSITDAGLAFGAAPTPPQAFGKIDEAAEFVLHMLKDGPLPARSIFAKAQASGISRSSINRAKKKLAVQSIKQGNSWAWALEEQLKDLQQPLI